MVKHQDCKLTGEREREVRDDLKKKFISTKLKTMELFLIAKDFKKSNVEN